MAVNECYWERKGKARSALVSPASPSLENTNRGKQASAEAYKKSSVRVRDETRYRANVDDVGSSLRSASSASVLLSLLHLLTEHYCTTIAHSSNERV